MFFLFGMDVRARERGIVADVCPACRDLRWLAVVDYYRVFEAYFIPLGKGRLQGSSVRCVACGLERAMNPERYAEVLPDSERAQGSARQAVERTTPELARRLRGIRSLLDLEPGYRQAASARELLERAVGLLEQLELGGESASEYLARLRGWRELSDAARRELVAELSGFAAHLRRSAT